MFIPVNEPCISTQAKRNVTKALQSGWLSSAGPFVTQFEEGFSAYVGMKYGIAVANGTAALHVALLSLGIGRGDEVIVPAFTMAASWLAVLYTGATPVFVDCDLQTFTMDPKLIEPAITRRTKAIMPVHIYGHACDMRPIMQIAKRHKLFVIEDAAEAHGGEYRGQKCGSFGDVSCFSFYANKIISTGEGGMVLTNNVHIAQTAKKFRDLCHSDKKRFIHDNIGYNYRLTNIQAAIGCGELERINYYLAKKQEMAEQYTRGLSGIPGIRTPVTRPGVKNVFWMYAILVEKQGYGRNRDELKHALRERGIDTRDFFYPPDEQPVLRPFLKRREQFPHTSYAAAHGLYLPSGLAMTRQQIRSVITSIRELAVPSLSQTPIRKR